MPGPNYRAALAAGWAVEFNIERQIPGASDHGR
jgi:hypothetical protein